jgi:hypothetical protein
VIAGDLPSQRFNAEMPEDAEIAGRLNAKIAEDAE